LVNNPEIYIQIVKFKCCFGSICTTEVYWNHALEFVYRILLKLESYRISTLHYGPCLRMRHRPSVRPAYRLKGKKITWRTVLDLVFSLVDSCKTWNKFVTSKVLYHLMFLEAYHLMFFFSSYRGHSLITSRLREAEGSVQCDTLWQGGEGSGGCVYTHGQKIISTVLLALVGQKLVWIDRYRRLDQFQGLRSTQWKCWNWKTANNTILRNKHKCKHCI